MRLLILVHGNYGQRIARHIQAHCPPGWRVESLTLPRALPPIVDEPEEFLAPPFIPPSFGGERGETADLILHLGETPQAAQLLPGVVTLTEAKAVIAPLDNTAWLPEGLKNQLKGEMAVLGAEAIFPMPFCSLTEESFGFGQRAKPYHNWLIARFARHFGRPCFTLKIDTSGGVVEDVIVERGSPCGSTHFAAAKLRGKPITEIVPQAGLIALHYPCLASMRPLRSGNHIETLMHISGCIVNEEMQKELKRKLRRNTCP